MAPTYKDKAARARRIPMLTAGRRSIYPAGLLVLSYSVLFALTYIYLVRVSYHDPTSYFFDPQRAYQKSYSGQRILEAEKYIRYADNASIPAHTATRAPKICVGIATVARRGEQYLDLTVGSLLDGLTRVERQDIFLDVLIAHTDQAQHPSFAHKWLDLLPDRLLQYDRDEATMAQLRTWEEGGWYRNKTIYDYTYLLRDCYETGAEYIAMIEDDTLAAKNWFRRTVDALGVIEKSAANAQSSSNWIYLRLFYSDDLHGWNSEEWPQYLFWSCVVWLCCGGCLLAARRGLKRGPERVSVSVLVVTLSFCVPATVGLYFLAGKQTVAPLKTGVQQMNKYGCCSQGFVFPRAIVPAFLDHTDLTTDWLVDMMVEKLADAEGWTRWALVPPVLQHIGVTSSKGYGFDDSAKRLWNFRFEQGLT